MRSVERILTIVVAVAAVGVFTPVLVTPVYTQNASPTEIAAMQREYRRPPPQPIDNQALVELGRDLFFAPQLSASGKTSCANCHFAELGWGVIDARSRNDSGKLTARKSQ